MPLNLESLRTYLTLMEGIFLGMALCKFLDGAPYDKTLSFVGLWMLAGLAGEMVRRHYSAS